MGGPSFVQNKIYSHDADPDKATLSNRKVVVSNPPKSHSNTN